MIVRTIRYQRSDRTWLVARILPNSREPSAVVGIAFVGLASTVGAVNFVVTFFKLRAPGMSLDRVPLFVWNVTVTAFMMIFAASGSMRLGGMGR